MSGALKTISSDASKMRADKRKQMKKGGNAKQAVVKQVETEPEPASEPATSKPKRGQHGRKKKLKEKYKFQDDEERELRMQLLQVKYLLRVISM